MFSSPAWCAQSLETLAAWYLGDQAVYRLALSWSLESKLPIRQCGHGAGRSLPRGPRAAAKSPAGHTGFFVAMDTKVSSRLGANGIKLKQPYMNQETWRT